MISCKLVQRVLGYGAVKRLLCMVTISTAADKKLTLFCEI